MRTIDADRLRTLLVGCLPGWVYRGTIDAAFPESADPKPASVGNPPVPSDDDLRREFSRGMTVDDGLRAVAAMAVERARPRISMRWLQKAIVQGWGCNMVADTLREAGVAVEEDA